MTAKWRSDKKMESLSIRVSRRAQVDTTTSLHPGSYGSSLNLKNVMVTSKKIKRCIVTFLGVEKRREGEVGRRATAASWVAAWARAKHRQSRATLATVRGLAPHSGQVKVGGV